MKIAPREIAGFLKHPPKNLIIAVFHGSDYGLVSEQAAQLAKVSVDNLSDPFAVTNLDSTQITTDPALLYDTAAQAILGGGRRLVKIGQGNDTLVEPCRYLLDNPPDDVLVIITAPDLNTKSKLVKLAVSHPKAAAIGCYADTPRDIAGLAREVFAQFNIKAEIEAITWIATHLGGDRLSTRSELDKLVTLAGTGGLIDLAMAREALGDSAAITVSAVTAAAASGDMARLGVTLDRAVSEAIAPEALLRGGLAYFRKIFRLAVMIEGGMSKPAAISAYKPPIFFNEKDVISAHLEHWGSGKAMRAMERCATGEKQARSGINQMTATAQSLLAICRLAKMPNSAVR